jgi:hypothetical protein
MAINALIAQGIRPIGADLPEVGSLLNQNRQMNTRNALTQQGMDLDRQRNDAYMRQVGLQERNALAQGEAGRIQALRQQAASVLDNLQSIAGTPQYGATVQQLQASPGVVEAAGALGLDVAALSDPSYLTAARGIVGMQAAPKAVPFDQTEKGQELAARFKFDSQIKAQESAAARELERLRQRRPAAGGASSAPVANAPVKLTPQEAKAQRDAKARLPTVNATLRRVDRVSQAVESLAGNKFFDGGPLDQFVVGPSEKGQELQQSVASLMPTLTALTRVPGIGSQSDLEQRLAMLQLPSAEFRPEVNRRAIAELRLFVSDLQNAYTSAAGMEPAPTQAGASGSWDQPEGIPDGIDPSDWEYMTEEERAVFR